MYNKMIKHGDAKKSFENLKKSLCPARKALHNWLSSLRRKHRPKMTKSEKDRKAEVKKKKQEEAKKKEQEEEKKKQEEEKKKQEEEKEKQ